MLFSWNSVKAVQETSTARITLYELAEEYHRVSRWDGFSWSSVG